MSKELCQQLRDEYVTPSYKPRHYLTFAGDIIEAQAKEIESLKAENLETCHLVAKMHLAARGNVVGPRLGVVEDIAELRAALVELSEASSMYGIRHTDIELDAALTRCKEILT